VRRWDARLHADAALTPRTAPGAASPLAWAAGWSLRRRLVLLVLAGIAPLLLFAFCNVYYEYRYDRAQAGQRMLDLTRGLSLAVERELEASTSGLRALALSMPLRNGDVDAFRGQAKAFLAQQPPGATLGLADASGKLLVVVGATLLPDAPLPRRNNLASVTQVFATGRPVISGFYRSVVSGRPSFSVDVPVFRDGRVAYDLALNLGLSALADIIAQQHPRPGWVVSIFDAAGINMARVPNPARFVGQQATRILLPYLQAERERVARNTMLEGTPVLVAWSHAEPSGWSVAIGVPVADLAAPALRSLLLTLAAGGAAALIGLLLAQAAARSITDPLMALNQLAAAAAGDGRLDLPDTGLREVDAVARTLRTTTAERRAREADFRTLAETMPSLVFTTDAAGANAYANLRFQQYSGLDAGQLRGSGWMQILLPDDVGRTAAARAAAVATGEPYQLEYRFRRHDGAFRWFLGRAAPVRGTPEAGHPDGRITRWVGTCTDIDEQKRAETALADVNQSLEEQVAERSRELDRIFRLSLDVLAVSDFDGRLRSMSPAWERITGRPVADMMGRSYREDVHPEDREATFAAVERLRRGEPVANFVNRYPHADGSWRWLAWSGMPVHEEGLIYSVARDVTEKRAREEQLRQSQKMEVVGQLTGGIAHDFNNLLTIIIGCLELAQRSLDADADARLRRRIAAAMEGAHRAAQLTHRLLAFSRRQPLQPQPIEPNRLVAGMSDLLHHTLGEQVAVETVLAGGLWHALADPNQLENAILNLAVNARDAMPEGGRLTIETANVHLDEPYAAAQAEVSPGQYVMVAVTDTGVGMTPEVKAHVFEPFFTTKPVGQGTGLGLAQVYGFIKQSGGHVAIYSEPGQGTTVRLYLPRLAGAVRHDPAPAAEPAAYAAQGRGETVLVVEDEAGVRDFTVEVLQEAGYRVLATEDAAAALALLHAPPEVALLFTGVVLAGGMNGRQLADEARRQRPGLRVLFTTGYTRNAIIHHGRLDEGVQMIGKPFSATSLARKVRAVLDGSGAA
jgi:PAS domain S-box-containing protein